MCLEVGEGSWEYTKRIEVIFEPPGVLEHGKVSEKTRKDKFQRMRWVSGWTLREEKEGKKMKLSKDLTVLEMVSTRSNRPVSRRAIWPWQRRMGVPQPALKL